MLKKTRSILFLALLSATSSCSSQQQVNKYSHYFNLNTEIFEAEITENFIVLQTLDHKFYKCNKDFSDSLELIYDESVGYTMSAGMNSFADILVLQSSSGLFKINLDDNSIQRTIKDKSFRWSERIAINPKTNLCMGRFFIKGYELFDSTLVQISEHVEKNSIKEESISFSSQDTIYHATKEEFFKYYPKLDSTAIICQTNLINNVQYITAISDKYILGEYEKKFNVYKYSFGPETITLVDMDVDENILQMIDDNFINDEGKTNISFFNSNGETSILMWNKNKLILIPIDY